MTVCVLLFCVVWDVSAAGMYSPPHWQSYSSTKLRMTTHNNEINNAPIAGIWLTYLLELSRVRWINNNTFINECLVPVQKYHPLQENQMVVYFAFLWQLWHFIHLFDARMHPRCPAGTFISSIFVMQYVSYMEQIYTMFENHFDTVNSTNFHSREWQ